MLTQSPSQNSDSTQSIMMSAPFPLHHTAFITWGHLTLDLLAIACLSSSIVLLKIYAVQWRSTNLAVLALFHAVFSVDLVFFP